MGDSQKKLQRRQSSLRVLQANVQKGGANHDMALSIAFENNCDLLLIQEPWIHNDLQRRCTKTHPAFETFAPCTQWDKRPRVITYVRKGRGLAPCQPAANICQDLLLVALNSRDSPMLIWNIYNAPSGAIDAGAGLQALLQYEHEAPTLVAGDFNIRHSLWDATGETPQDGEDLIQWADSHSLRIANPPFIPTHQRGGVLDLTLVTHPKARCEVEPSLHTSSDHESLLTIIPLARSLYSKVGRLNLGTCDTVKYLQLLQHTTEPVYNNLEEETSDIVQALNTALHGSCRLRLEAAGGAPWWNDVCRAAHQKYRALRRTGPAEEERKALRRCVRQAKQTYWQQIVQDAAKVTDVYKIVKWHKKETALQSPPLQKEGGLATTPQEKAQVLQEALLSRHLEAEDIPADTPAVPRRSIPWSSITAKEVFSAVCQVSSTSPGADEIPAAALRMAWPAMGARITLLFQRLTEEGVHPQAFKHAEVVILPKAGKRDRSLPKSYRPIALLSCLGKGLERLLARRINFWALKLKILARDQCSAISKRSAVDLTTALASDIEEAWAKGLVAGMLTVDVKGAFDGVLANRLIQRLREQGWPNCLVQWVRSFLANRTAHIRLDKVKSKAFSVLCGLPQGSPISPILFLLYVEPFLRLTKGRFGYADDGAMLAVGATTQVVHAKLQKHLDITLAWGQENGVLFDSAKTELQYFHRKRKANDLPLHLPEGLEILPNKATRWLGVFFDRKLSFKAHVQTACLRAKQITDHVQRLCRTVKGAKPALLRQAVQGCAFATLFYGAETWYGKHTSPAIFRLIQLAINRAARAVLPVYKTTPTPALLRETGWAPALAWLERAHDRFVARVAAADERHPLRTRWGSSRMKWIRRRQELALSPTFFRPPWEDVDRDRALKQIAACGRAAGPQAFKQWLEKQPILDLIVYSDGSMNEDGNAGAAYCIYRGSQLLEQGQVPLGRTAEVYDAEVAGALAGLNAALRTCMARFATNVTICLDNQEAALRLHTGIPTSTSASEIMEFQACRQAWLIRERARNATRGAVGIRWCPAHIGIAGNELADQLAKAACLLPTTRTQASVACAQRLSKLRYEQAATEYWSVKRPTQYERLNLPFPTSRMLIELTLPRPTLGYLLAARSGHGDFRAYHERFNHANATLHCQHCNQDSSPEHFASCEAISPPFELFAPTRCPNPARWALSTTEGVKAFAKWCTRTRFFVHS